MKKSGFLAAAAILGLTLLISFVIDWRNLGASGSIDLRNRITGIRLLEEGQDPFHYKWRTHEPERFCDPYNNLAVSVSKTTVTPAFLVLHAPLGALPYRPAQYLWLLAQWGALLGMLALWRRALPPGLSFPVLGLFVAGFTFTAAWRLHAERGQCYAILAFLLACWLVLSREPGQHPRRAVWAGALAGVLIALRPPLLLVIAPFLLWRRREQWPGLGLGLAAGAVLPLFLDPGCWGDYGSAMQTWSDLYRSGANPRPPRQAFPAMVEGIPIDILGRFAGIPFADSSLFYGLRRLGFNSVPALPVLGLFVALSGLWTWLARRQTDQRLLLGVAVGSFAIDFFLPALRNTYNDVMMVNAVAAALALAQVPLRLTWLAFLGLPLGWFVLAATPRAPGIINLPSLVFLFAALAWLLCPWTVRRTRLDHPAVRPAG